MTRFAITLSAACALLLTIVACLPPSDSGTSLLPDKVQHALAFAIAILPVALIGTRRTVRNVAIFLLCIGILIEIIQPWFGRDRSIYDVMADIVGLALGTLTGRGLQKRWRSQVAPVASDPK